MALYVKQRDLPTQNLDFRKQALLFPFISTHWAFHLVNRHCIGIRLRWAKHGACPPRIYGQVEKTNNSELEGSVVRQSHVQSFKNTEDDGINQFGKMCSLMCSPGQVNLHYCESSVSGTESRYLSWLPNKIQVVCLNICLVPAKTIKLVEELVSIWESPRLCILCLWGHFRKWQQGTVNGWKHHLRS